MRQKVDKLDFLKQFGVGKETVMIFVRQLFTGNEHTLARIWACGIYANSMFCSKHLIAEALFEEARLDNRPEITEIVCASRGNLAVSVAALALRYRKHATIVLPVWASKRTVDLLRLLGAGVILTDKSRLREEVGSIAREYASAVATRCYLDQFDLDWCQKVYRSAVFDELRDLLIPVTERRLRLIVPCGTGSLLLAAADFLSRLSSRGHQVVPVFLQDPDRSQQTFLDESKARFPHVEFLSAAVPTQQESLTTLRTMALSFEIPFGMTSADCLAVALRQQKQVSADMDIVPLLTDSLLVSDVSFVQTN